MRLFIVCTILLAWAGFFTFLWYSITKNKRGIATETEHARNHLNMARWIERVTNDDMVRVTIPGAEQREASRLLDEFYGEDNNINNRKGI